MSRLLANSVQTVGKPYPYYWPPCPDYWPTLSMKSNERNSFPYYWQTLPYYWPTLAILLTNSVYTIGQLCLYYCPTLQLIHPLLRYFDLWDSARQNLLELQKEEKIKVKIKNKKILQKHKNKTERQFVCRHTSTWWKGSNHCPQPSSTSWTGSPRGRLSSECDIFSDLCHVNIY